MSKTCPSCGATTDDDATLCPYCFATIENKTTQNTPAEKTEDINTEKQIIQPLTEVDLPKAEINPDAYKQFLPAYKKTFILDFIAEGSYFIMQLLYFLLPMLFFVDVRKNYSWITFIFNGSKAITDMDKNAKIIFIVMIALIIVICFTLFAYRLAISIKGYINRNKDMAEIYKGCLTKPLIVRNDFKMTMMCVVELALGIFIAFYGELKKHLTVNVLFAVPCVLTVICLVFEILAHLSRKKLKTDILSDANKIQTKKPA